MFPSCAGFVFLLTVNLLVSLVVLVSFLSLLQSGVSPLSPLRCTSSLLTSRSCFEPGLPESSPFLLLGGGCSLELLHGCYSGPSRCHPRVFLYSLVWITPWYLDCIFFSLHYFCSCFLGAHLLAVCHSDECMR